MDPNKTTILIHEDLLLYKHVYEQICNNLKETLNQNKHLEEVIDNLREENARYSNLIKNIKASALKDQKYLISEFFNTVSRDKPYSHNYSDNDTKKVTPISDKETSASLSFINKESKATSMLEEIQEQGELESEIDEDDDYTYNLYSPIAVNFPDKIKGDKSFSQTYGLIPALDLSKTNNTNYKIEKKKMKLKTSRLTKKLKTINNDEWRVALKHAGLNEDEIVRLSGNKLLSRVIEAMMNLNRIIEEKNYLILGTVNKLKQVQDEKAKKEQENIDIYQKLINMRKEVEKLIEINKKPHRSAGKSNPLSKNSSDKKVLYINTECSMIVHNDQPNSVTSNEILEEKDLIISDERTHSSISENEEEESDENRTEVR